MNAFKKINGTNHSNQQTNKMRTKQQIEILKKNNNNNHGKVCCS